MMPFCFLFVYGYTDFWTRPSEEGKILCNQLCQFVRHSVPKVLILLTIKISVIFGIKLAYYYNKQFERSPIFEKKKAQIWGFLDFESLGFSDFAHYDRQQWFLTDTDVF